MFLTYLKTMLQEVTVIKECQGSWVDLEATSPSFVIVNRILGMCKDRMKLLCSFVNVEVPVRLPKG